MIKVLQYTDGVIEAARILRQELIEFAPFEDSESVAEWVRLTYPEVCALADATTEAEEPVTVVGGLNLDLG